MSRIHVRAPGSGSSGGLPGNIGLDPSAPGMQKAAQYWEMLDELHKSDPEAYQKLIDEQVHAGRKKSRTRQFLPTPGFVLKTFSLAAATGRRKLFINIVAFDGVEPPTSGNGKVLDEEAHGYQARSIPLLVSPLREVPILKGGDVVNCVDVVFNPWVLRKCDQESSFKQQVIRLAIRWVQDETSLVVSIPDARVINSLYKGGRGPNLRDPVPFPITLSEEEMRELYPEEHQKQQQQQQKSAKPPVMQNPSDLLQAFRAGAETAAGESGGANVPGLHVASGGSGTSAPAPAGAAAAGESFSNAQQHSALDGLLNVSARPEVRSADGTTRTDPRANGPSRSEIREVVSDGGRSSNSTSSASQRHPGIREVIDPKDANASKKKKGAIRKGFIFRQKKKKGQVKPLYPEGSQEHKPENPYPCVASRQLCDPVPLESRCVVFVVDHFLQCRRHWTQLFVFRGGVAICSLLLVLFACRWANVIDLGSSDQDKLKRQMEEYAQTGNVNEPTFRAKQPEPKRLAEWDPRYKAQQDCEAKEKKEANLKAQKQREAKVGTIDANSIEVRCRTCTTFDSQLSI